MDLVGGRASGAGGDELVRVDVLSAGGHGASRRLPQRAERALHAL